MKKILLLLLLSFLAVSKFQDSVYAECNTCYGDWQSRYGEYINDPFIWYFVGHEIYEDGSSYCKSMAYSRVQSHEIGDYFIRYDVLNSNGEYDLKYGYIYISEDEQFDLTTYSGEEHTTYLSDYTGSNLGGESNGKYYGGWIHLGLYAPYTIDYAEFDYIVKVDNDGLQLDQFHELARYLCGETSELPNGVTVSQQKPINDLEPPLNIKVDGINNNMFNNKQKSLKIRWEQSNIDLSGYETHFYFKESGRTRKTIFNEWQDVSTNWLSDKKLTTAKYCNNNLKYYEYKWWTEQSKLGDYANALLYGDESGGLMCEHSAVDFMIRNEKIDDNGVQHYSNWVYVNCFNDGTYQIYEMSDDYTLDKDSDETGNIKTDSDIYDSDTIYDEKDFDSTGVGDATNFIDSMKDLISSLREFPNLFAKIFSFFPAWILALIGMLFVAVLLARLFL